MNDFIQHIVSCSSVTENVFVKPILNHVQTISSVGVQQRLEQFKTRVVVVMQ